MISVLLLFCTDTDIVGKNAISVADIVADPIIGTPLAEIALFGQIRLWDPLFVQIRLWSDIYAI